MINDLYLYTKRFFNLSCFEELTSVPNDQILAQIVWKSDVHFIDGNSGLTFAELLEADNRFIPVLFSLHHG